MKLARKLKLSHKLLLLGLLPAVTLSIALSIYFTKTLITDAEKSLHERGNSLTYHLSKASVYGVFSGNTEQLDDLLRSFSGAPEPLLIEISDINNKLLASFHKSEEALNNNQRSVFTRPIYTEKTQYTDDFDNLLLNSNDATISNIIGYVKLQLSHQPTKIRQQAILVNSIFITLISSLGILVIALISSYAIAKPMLKLVEDVTAIRKGHFKHPTSLASGDDEIASLTRNIHKMAHEIENHQLQLELKIQEATTSLENKNSRLLEAQKKLIQTTNSKSNFISHMSHEIRTPLNGIIGFLELLNQTSLTEKQTRLLEPALSSSNHLKFVSNEVLDTAQLETGKLIINKSSFKISNIVKNTISILTTLATKNNVTITFSIDDLTPNVIYQDPIKIGQILINLLSNAIKFSPNTEVKLEINTPPQTDLMEIKVIDRGCGITTNNIEMLFDQFTQFSPQEYVQGSGLGLAITQKITRSMGGNISVQSEIGQGSTFIAIVPYEIINEPALIDSQEIDLSGLRILIADDNEINRDFLSLILEQKEALIDLAVDGQEAIQLAAQNKYDLMLLDINMPYKKGNEVLNEIRADRENINNSTLAVAITAHVASESAEAAYKSNFDSYLIKPFISDQLFHLISQLINGNTPKQPFSPTLSEELAPIFDQGQRLKSMSEDYAFAASILDKLFNELVIQSKEIKEALSKASFNQALELVHKVHGSAAYCGTVQLKNTSKALEESLIKITSAPEEISDIDSSLSSNQLAFFTQLDTLLEHRQKIMADLKRTFQ